MGLLIVEEKVKQRRGVEVIIVISQKV